MEVTLNTKQEEEKIYSFKDLQVYGMKGLFQAIGDWNYMICDGYGHVVQLCLGPKADNAKSCQLIGNVGNWDIIRFKRVPVDSITIKF